MSDADRAIVMMLHDNAALISKCERLQAENAKLRELLEDMLDCMEIREAFGRPPTSEMCEEFAQRAGELGIDV